MSDTKTPETKTPETKTPETKTPETKTEQAQAPAPTRASIKLGEQVRLRAAHGFIQNPFTLDNFDLDISKKVVVDSWTLIQYEAGKLEVDSE